MGGLETTFQEEDPPSIRMLLFLFYERLQTFSAESIKNTENDYKGIMPVSLESVYESMPHQLEACIEAREGNTKYLCSNLLY